MLSQKKEYTTHSWRSHRCLIGRPQTHARYNASIEGRAPHQPGTTETLSDGGIDSFVLRYLPNSQTPAADWLTDVAQKASWDHQQWEFSAT